MTLFSVDIVRKDCFTVVVEAETAKEAMEDAMFQITESLDPMEDFDSFSDGFEVVGCR